MPLFHTNALTVVLHPLVIMGRATFALVWVPNPRSFSLPQAQGQCPAGRVFQYRVGSGRVLDKIPGSGSGSGRVRVSKNMIGYFRVSFFLSGISGYFGYFRVCRVFLGISGFTHIYFLTFNEG